MSKCVKVCHDFHDNSKWFEFLMPHFVLQDTQAQDIYDPVKFVMAYIIMS